MRFWLTTHYPHPVPDKHPWHIYLKRQHKDAVEGIGVGDRVFFYEYKHQKPVKGETNFALGKEGIVRVARVSGEMYRRDSAIEYADGTTGYWSWGVPTDSADVDGFVPRRALLPEIGHKPGSVLRGFNGGTGVMELNDAQCNRLVRLFKSRAR
jgi:hypothetical protein